MKTMKYLSMMLVILAMSVCMASCGDDDNDEPSTGIVGTWVSDDDVTFVFRNDGTGVLSDEDGSSNFDYTYSQSKETLLLMFKGTGKGTEYSVQRTGNKLTLSTGNTYIKLTKK